MNEFVRDTREMLYCQDLPGDFRTNRTCRARSEDRRWRIV